MNKEQENLRGQALIALSMAYDIIKELVALSDDNSRDALWPHVNRTMACISLSVSDLKGLK